MRQYKEDDLDGMRFVGSNGGEYLISKKESNRFLVQRTDDRTGITRFDASITTILYYLDNSIWVPTKSWVIEQFYKQCITQ